MLSDLKSSGIERPLHDIVFFNALKHPKERSEYPWDHGLTLVAMPPLEPYSEHAIFAKTDVSALNDQRTRFLVSIFSHDNYYSSYQTTNLIFFGKAFEILITSFYRDLSPSLLNRTLSEPPFHSSFSAFQTKTLEAETWEDEDQEGINPELPFNENLNSFIQEVATWRNEHLNKDSLVLPAQLVVKAMNKAFSLFILLKTEDRMRNNTMYTVVERFRRIILSSFSSFEKNVLGDDSVVVLQNVGVVKQTDKINIDEASFKQDPSYRINIRPLLAEPSTVTYALSRHPLFAWMASTNGGDTLLVKSATRRATVLASQRINDILEPHTEFLRKVINNEDAGTGPSLHIKKLIKEISTDPLVNKGKKPINLERSEMFRLLLQAARKFNLHNQLEAWQTS
jgi:hypothetical protein